MKTPQLVLTIGAALLLSGHATLESRGHDDGIGDITEATIRSHMEFLASDAMNGRGSGTEDEWRAADYIGVAASPLGHRAARR